MQGKRKKKKTTHKNQEIFKILLNNNCQENWTLRADFVMASGVPSTKRVIATE